MTRDTALALILRIDIDAELLAAGRPLTRIDVDDAHELWQRARSEIADVRQLAVGDPYSRNVGGSPR